MDRSTLPTEQDLTEQLNDLLRGVGARPDEFSVKLAREIMHTAVKLIQDEADTGELKLISRSLKELRYALKVFRDYSHIRKVSIFGSARTPDDHPAYQTAVAFSRKMAERGWMVITGAGGGIMRAGHGGAGRDASFGVAIRLPFETTANEYIEGDRKLIVFRYFFTRKLIFASQSHAMALLPGGFGTQDEGFEILTLIQTGKAPIVPVVLLDSPDSDYWSNWDQHVRRDLLGQELINPEDLNLYMVTKDVDAAVDHLFTFYRNYHSLRFVRAILVIRMMRPLNPDQMARLNDEFADLVVDGKIEQGGPLSAEHEHLELPRLRFIFTRRQYGRLRLMIDRINEFDLEAGT